MWCLNVQFLRSCPIFLEWPCCLTSDQQSRSDLVSPCEECAGTVRLPCLASSDSTWGCGEAFSEEVLVRGSLGFVVVPGPTPSSSGFFFRGCSFLVLRLLLEIFNLSWLMFPASSAPSLGCLKPSSGPRALAGQPSYPPFRVFFFFLNYVISGFLSTFSG